MDIEEAIEVLKSYNVVIDIGEVNQAIDTVVDHCEKPTCTPADMEEFSYWYHRKVSVIGESELHLFGVRPFEDIISFWKKEKEATE